MRIEIFFSFFCLLLFVYVEQILFLIVLLTIFFQDFRDRKVYLFLFILGVLQGGSLHFTNTILEVFLWNITINLVVILFITIVLYLYIKIKLKKHFLNAIGIGDFLFFLLFSISFPIFTFLILFSTSLIFSLLLFIVLKPILQDKTVPLAGFQALFLSLVLVLNWFFNFVNLYAI